MAKSKACGQMSRTESPGQMASLAHAASALDKIRLNNDVEMAAADVHVTHRAVHGCDSPAKDGRRQV